VQLVDAPELRCWFQREDGSRLLQLQSNRFILNWQKSSSEAEYPRFHNLKPEFASAWKLFTGFLSETKLEVPKILQCEITYVDLFPRGSGWNSYGELHQLTPMIAPAKLTLGTPEAVTLNVRFPLPEERGRLYAVFQPAIRATDGKEVMRLDLTARGAPRHASIDEALNWFDFGHNWAVRAFLEITTSNMQQLWGKLR
jgi:uncharacterized protein (TIGR04255 family)